MKVILTEKVKSLGGVGDIVNVSAGYARNYLVPEGFAVIADAGQEKALNNQKRALAKKIEAEKGEAEALKAKIDGYKLDLVKRSGPNGKLFGTVTNTELSKELEALGMAVERRHLIIETPIKALGSYTVKAKLFKDVSAEFSVTVSLDPKQAEEMKAKEAELAKEKKKLEEEAAKKAAEEGEEGADKKEAAPMTEEQRLKAEADKLLRSFD
jgi:large subunit ribosomal protein L9